MPAEMRINMIRELALKNRSYRRFYGEKKIDEKTLRELVDIARNTPSAANRQPLQYRLVCDDEQTAVYTTVLAGQAIIRTGTVR